MPSSGGALPAAFGDRSRSPRGEGLTLWAQEDDEHLQVPHWDLAIYRFIRALPAGCRRQALEVLRWIADLIHSELEDECIFGIAASQCAPVPDGEATLVPSHLVVTSVGP